jgi:hypothetical protein
MATTTPNYGWTVPTSTDLVKDGATAIETLGDAIDASMNTALGTKKAGMVLRNTTSFSAVASQSVNDVFSATYDNYKVIVNLDSTSSTGHDTYFRLRVGGADLSSSTYNGSLSFVRSSGTLGGSYSTTRTGWGFLDSAISPGCQTFMEIGNPFRTTGKHTAYWTGWGIAGGEDAIKFFAGQVAAGTSYTGFSIVNIGTGTVTGSVSVYGYSK